MRAGRGSACCPAVALCRDGGSGIRGRWLAGVGAVACSWAALKVVVLAIGAADGMTAVAMITPPVIVA